MPSSSPALQARQAKNDPQIITDGGGGSGWFSGGGGEWGVVDQFQMHLIQLNIPLATKKCYRMENKLSQVGGWRVVGSTENKANSVFAYLSYLPDILTFRFISCLTVVITGKRQP